MTDYQKKRITLMRKQNVGYAMIAKELKLSLGSVKQFCRRNGLQSGDLEADKQSENISETLPDIGLISDENRGNTTTAHKPKKRENAGVSGNQPVCEITISYAETDDDMAVADVLGMLQNAHYPGR